MPFCKTKQKENKMQSSVIHLQYVLNILWASYYRLPTKQFAFYESKRTLNMLILRLKISLNVAGSKKDLNNLARIGMKLLPQEATVNF